MKHFIITLCAGGLLFGICFADEELILKDQKDKECYSLGYQFGQLRAGPAVSVAEMDSLTYMSGKPVKKG